MFVSVIVSLRLRFTIYKWGTAVSTCGCITAKGWMLSQQDPAPSPTPQVDSLQPVCLMWGSQPVISVKWKQDRHGPLPGRSPRSLGVARSASSPIPGASSLGPDGSYRWPWMATEREWEGDAVMSHWYPGPCVTDWAQSHPSQP